MSAKRRGNGGGTIRRLASGRWSWSVMIGRNPDGTPKHYRVTADTRAELNEKIIEFMKKNGTHPKVVPGFKNFSEEWWKRYKVNLRVSTKSSLHSAAPSSRRGGAEWSLSAAVVGVI